MIRFFAGVIFAVILVICGIVTLHWLTDLSDLSVPPIEEVVTESKIVQEIKATEEPEPEKEPIVITYEEVKKDLEHVEGRENRIYKDTNGYLTGGIGHKLLASELKHWKRGSFIPDDQIDKWFRQDYERIIMKGVQRYFPRFSTYPVKAQLAIVNFLFQLGTDAPLKFPKATAAINAEPPDWARAADEWEYANVKLGRKSKWFHQTKNRCIQEVHRLRSLAKKENE